VVKLIFPEPDLCDTRAAMNEPGDNLPKQNYQWPWFVLAAVVLFVMLAVVFVGFKARQIKQESDFDVPLPASTPAH
jgi:nitrate reductase NapE component